MYNTRIGIIWQSVCERNVFNPLSQTEFFLNSIQVFVPVLHEIFVDPELFCVFVINLLNRRMVEAINLCPGTCHEDWRVSSDDKLGMPCLAHLL